jgi:hypothetical protein
MPHIGVLSLGRGDKSDASLATIDAFIPALGELGYTEGRNMAFERKFADGDANKLRALAQELVAHGVNATVALSTPVARAAKQATSVIPIVAIGSFLAVFFVAFLAPTFLRFGALFLVAFFRFWGSSMSAAPSAARVTTPVATVSAPFCSASCATLFTKVTSESAGAYA